MNALDLVAAASVGLLGGVHCVGMCGGIVGALTLALPLNARSGWRRLYYVLVYNLGRVFSYSVAGLLAGSLGHWANSGQQGFWFMLAAALMLLLLGLHLAGWSSILTRVERLGQGFWRYLQPLSQRLFPIERPFSAFLLGVLWGWLPCGLVYSSLAWAALSGNLWDSALKMLAFGLGTLPVLLLMGGLAERVAVLARNKKIKTAIGLILILYALVSAYQAWLHNQAGHHHHPLPTSTSEPLQGSDSAETEHQHHHHE